jgi:hypothetical protein
MAKGQTGKRYKTEPAASLIKDMDASIAEANAFISTMTAEQ